VANPDFKLICERTQP